VEAAASVRDVIASARLETWSYGPAVAVAILDNRRGALRPS
jgi:hypothetical protein